MDALHALSPKNLVAAILDTVYYLLQFVIIFAFLVFSAARKLLPGFWLSGFAERRFVDDRATELSALR